MKVKKIAKAMKPRKYDISQLESSQYVSMAVSIKTIVWRRCRISFTHRQTRRTYQPHLVVGGANSFMQFTKGRGWQNIVWGLVCPESTRLWKPNTATAEGLAKW